MPTETGSQPTSHKYLKVRDYLVALAAEELAVGDPVPSERALTQRFGVSRMTVRHAIDALVSEGVLEKVQGRGTFVSAPRMDFEVRLSTFGEQMQRLGLSASTTVLDSGAVAAPAEVAAVLGVSPGAQVHHLRRQRRADGKPMAIEEAWIPVALAPRLFDDGPPPSLYDALRTHGQDPQWGEETLAADIATREECELLDMSENSAVLRATRRTHGDDGAVMFSRSCFRGDRYQVWVPLAPPHVPEKPSRPSPAPTTSKEDS
ncbi:GntR family transcriptional regulator [Demequina sediminicola]|uniref:GntR family transcriptional regulator n=1 Tax=Demequina sediminicola TaxID=1095026 RepID=UPI000781ECE2|nr:GntR family transcriptional regulator [Demequina sediminicola]